MIDPNAHPGARITTSAPTKPTSPLALKGRDHPFCSLQGALIGSPSDEDEGEDDADTDGTVEATAPRSPDASDPRAKLSALSSSALVKQRRHLSVVAFIADQLCGQ